MDNVILQKIKDLIDKSDKIGIAVGKNPTVDTMASALSLSLGLAEYGKPATVVSASQPLVEHSSLVGIDKVKSSFDATGASTGGDLVVSFPYREGEIEKVSYTIDSGYLNIVVKAGEQGLTFEESDVRFKRGSGASGAPTLLFIVGTSRISDLGPLFDTEALKNTAIVNIDNKRDNQGFGDVPAVSQDASSVSEMVAQLLYYLGIDPSVDTAQNLMLGITDGTNNMQDPRVSYTTFELVANLMKKGVNRAQAPRPAPDAMTRFTGAPAAPAQRPQQQYPRNPMMQRPQGQRPGGFQRPNMPQRNPFGQNQQGSNSRFGGYQQDPYAQQQPPRFGGQQMPPMPPRTNPGGYQGQDFGTDEVQQPENPQPEMPRRDSQAQRGNMGGQRRDQGADRKPPSDWLTPKVYKGSQPPEENN